jgi:hypothetical protein
MQVNNNVSTAIAARAAQAPVAAPVAPETAPAVATVQDEGSGWENVTGLAKKIMDHAVDLGGDINKLPFWEKAIIAVVGFFLGWKMDQWVRDALAKKQGEEYNTFGQDKYLELAKNPAALVEEIGKKHTFAGNVMSGDVDASRWRAFQSYAVLRETAHPTVGDYEGRSNMPVALIAMAKNTTSDKTALTALAASVKMKVAGTPALQDFYQPVIDALKNVHGISV